MTNSSAINEERFDVVDEHDRVVGTMSRSEVHRRKLLHRAVHVFVFRSNGRLLIHRRSDSKEEFPSVWTSSCSGHVSAGETYDETAPRELQEELGIVALPKSLMKFSATADTSFEFTQLYYVTWDDDVSPDPHEMTAVRWITLPELTAWINQSPGDFSPAFLVLLGWFMEHQQQNCCT